VTDLGILNSRGTLYINL